MSEGPICKWWCEEDQLRNNVLERVRRYASLCNPALIPRSGQSPGGELERNYQSVCSRGMMTLEGKMLTSHFPVGQPWFMLALPAEIMANPTIPEAIKAAMARDLFINELTISSMLEQSSLLDETRCRQGLRTALRTAISYLLTTGDTLFQLTDDYRIKTFRTEQYVTNRDTCGDVLAHGIKESMDPRAMGEEYFVKTGLDAAKVKEKSPRERMEDLYTKVEYQPYSRTWVTTQEMCGQVVATSEDKISAMVSAFYKHLPGEDYGRGFFEGLYADAWTLDELDHKLLDFATMASKMHPLISNDSLVRDEDLLKPTGEVIRNARLVNGEAQDIGFLKLDKFADFQVVMALREAKRKDLAESFLMASAVMPQKERTTALQISEIAGELNGATGGVASPMTEQLHLPLLRRAVYQCRKDKILLPMQDGMVHLKSLTGLEAINREQQRGKLLDFAQVVNALGPEAQRALNPNVFLDTYQQAAAFWKPGLMKSPAQQQAEQQQAMAAQAQLAASQKAVDVIGNVAEDSLTRQAA